MRQDGTFWIFCVSPRNPAMDDAGRGYPALRRVIMRLPDSMKPPLALWLYPAYGMRAGKRGKNAIENPEASDLYA